jgi:hypothetical protein
MGNGSIRPPTSPLRDWSKEKHQNDIKASVLPELLYLNGIDIFLLQKK